MEKVELDFSEALEGVSSLADFLLAIRGKKAACNTYDFVETLSKNAQRELENILFEIENQLESITFSLVNNLLKAKGVLRYTGDCDWENLQNIYKLILEKGEFGYSELL